MQWIPADESSWWKWKLKVADYASLAECIAEFPAILGCAVAAPSGMRSFAFAAGCLEDPAKCTL